MAATRTTISSLAGPTIRPTRGSASPARTATATTIRVRACLCILSVGVFVAHILGVASLTVPDSSRAGADQEVDEYEERPQIIFCSRTHSQLSQFVNEIKRTAFADGLRCVSLGSRKNLCVHPEVRFCYARRRRDLLARASLMCIFLFFLIIRTRTQVSHLKSAVQINDACMDMQKSAGKKKTSDEIAAEAYAAATSKASTSTKISAVKSSCPYLSDDTQRVFRDHVLSRVRDLEQLHELGALNCARSSVLCHY